MALREFGEKVRIEDGFERKTAIATAELLSDEQTARHYAVGQRDAAGKRIVLGQEMTYLDYRGERGWYVYQWGEMADPEEPEGKRECFVPVAFYADEAEAEAHAQELAEQE